MMGDEIRLVRERDLPKGIFINIDEVYFDRKDGTRETAREWLKGVIKEAIEESGEKKCQ